MRSAREASEEQQLVVVQLHNDETGETRAIQIFYNNIQTYGFCFALSFGEGWTMADGEGRPTLITDSGRSSVAFTIITSQELHGISGSTAPERAVSFLDRHVAAQGSADGYSSKSIVERLILGSSSSKVLVLRYDKEPVSFKDGTVATFPTHYLVEAPNGQVFNLIVESQTRSRGDQLANQVVQNLVYSQSRECFLPALRALYEELEKSS